MQVIGPVIEVLLCLPTLAIWWWLHAAIDPTVIRAIPAPRRRTRDVEINPMHNDWRGFT